MIVDRRRDRRRHSSLQRDAVRAARGPVPVIDDRRRHGVVTCRSTSELASVRCARAHDRVRRLCDRRSRRAPATHGRRRRGRGARHPMVRTTSGLSRPVGRSPQRREEDHVADRLPAGEQHREPVDAEAEAARRRHAVGERLDVVRVAALALDLLRTAASKRSCCVAASLISRERVAELHPAGEVLEPLGERRVVVGRPRERRQLDRVVVDDRRLDQARLDEVRERVVDELRPVLVGLGVDAALGQPRAQLVRVARPELVLLERLDERDAPPRRRRGRSRGRGTSTAVVPSTSRATRSTSCSIRAIVSR